MSKLVKFTNEAAKTVTLPEPKITQIGKDSYWIENKDRYIEITFMKEPKNGTTIRCNSKVRL